MEEKNSHIPLALPIASNNLFIISPKIYCSGVAVDVFLFPCMYDRRVHLQLYFVCVYFSLLLPFIVDFLRHRLGNFDKNIKYYRVFCANNSFIRYEKRREIERKSKCTVEKETTHKQNRKPTTVELLLSNKSFFFSGVFCIFSLSHCSILWILELLLSNRLNCGQKMFHMLHSASTLLLLFFYIKIL